LHTAIDTEYGLLPPLCGVPGLTALLSENTLVHDAATRWAIADRRIRPSMIQVLAWVGPSEFSHQLTFRRISRT
jgi:hypothetical protein